MWGRGECYRIQFPSVELIEKHKKPFCECCRQRLNLAPLRPVFFHCFGENTGYDPCRSDDVISRWDEIDVDYYVDDDWQACHGQYWHLRKAEAELVLWACGYDVRPGIEETALQQAKDWLQLATTTSAIYNARSASVKFNEYRKYYAEWTLKQVKIRLREMKRAGLVPATACVR